jgi:hypothetical protein
VTASINFGLPSQATCLERRERAQLRRAPIARTALPVLALGCRMAGALQRINYPQAYERYLLVEPLELLRGPGRDRLRE